jgi:hypothetical protein
MYSPQCSHRKKNQPLPIEDQPNTVQHEAKPAVQAVPPLALKDKTDNVPSKKTAAERFALPATGLGLAGIYNLSPGPGSRAPLPSEYKALSAELKAARAKAAEDKKAQKAARKIKKPEEEAQEEVEP